MLPARHTLLRTGAAGCSRTALPCSRGQHLSLSWWWPSPEAPRMGFAVAAGPSACTPRPTFGGLKFYHFQGWGHFTMGPDCGAALSLREP